MQQTLKISKAFSLIEIVLVILITSSSLLAISSMSLSTVTNTQFTTTAQEIKQAILTSQSLSKQNYLDQRSGIAFEENKFTEFHADTFNSTDSLNRVTELYQGISISDIDFNSSDVLYFEKYTGLPIHSGSLKLNHSDGRSVLIEINFKGIVTLTYS